MEFFKANIIPGEVFVQILAFFIVFLTLKALAWKPLLKGLADRREKIENEFHRIAEAKKEIEALKAEYTAHINRIDEEARSKVQTAVDEGRRIAREIQDKARNDAQTTFEETKENLALEAAKIRIQLRREIAGLALQVSEKILEENLSGEKQQQKALAMLDDLEAALQKKGD